MPSQGVGGNGTASEFGDLTGLTRQEIDNFLCELGANVKMTVGGYIEYKFPDKSKVIIRPDGEIVRLPAPRYDSDGRNISKDGSLLPTRDEFGNPILSTHNTGERVSN